MDKHKTWLHIFSFSLSQSLGNVSYNSKCQLKRIDSIFIQDFWRLSWYQNDTANHLSTRMQSMAISSSPSHTLNLLDLESPQIRSCQLLCCIIQTYIQVVLTRWWCWNFICEKLWAEDDTVGPMKQVMGSKEVSFWVLGVREMEVLAAG